MRKLAYSFATLVLLSGAAYAQDAGQPSGDVPTEAHESHDAPSASTLPADSATPADPAVPPAPADAAADAGSAPDDSAAAAPADPATPAEPISTVAVTEAEVDSFARATVKLQEIQDDASIAADQKQTAMQAAVAEAGLDPAKYNEIGQAVQADPELRARVQTAMARHASPAPSDG